LVCLWGIGGLTYGLGVRYLGVSLGSTIILGLCSVFGSHLVPAVYYNFKPTAGKDSLSTVSYHPLGAISTIRYFICVVSVLLFAAVLVQLKEKDLAKAGAAANKNKDYRFGWVFL
jgi:L-rhamnose-H+ transport protein